MPRRVRRDGKIKRRASVLAKGGENMSDLNDRRCFCFILTSLNDYFHEIIYAHKSEGCASAVKRILGKIDGAFE
jgi:hypothetical protein